MGKFSRTVAQARSQTARQVLTVVAELRRIVAPEQELATGLEQDEIAALRPKPFPAQILSNDAISWLLDAVSAGMIDAEELINVQPDTVSAASPRPVHETAGEPWLQAQI
jgi:hypothetical protein